MVEAAQVNYRTAAQDKHNYITKARLCSSPQFLSKAQLETRCCLLERKKGDNESPTERPKDCQATHLRDNPTQLQQLGFACKELMQKSISTPRKSQVPALEQGLSIKLKSTEKNGENLISLCYLYVL